MLVRHHLIAIAAAALLVAADGRSQTAGTPLQLRGAPWLAQDSRLGYFSTDVSLAIGPRQFVVARNSAITLFEKAEGEGGPRRLSELALRDFLREATRDGDLLSDPIALYDPESQRFFLGNAAFGPCQSAETCDAGLQLAVSKTPVPQTLTSADWFFFRIDRALLRVNGTARRIQSHGDYDRLAAIGNSLLVSWQEANAPVFSVVRVLDKSRLIRGEAPQDWQDFIHEGNSRARLASVHDARDRLGDRAFLDIRARCTPDGMRWTIGAVVEVGRTPRLETREVTVPTTCHGDSTVTATQRDGSMPIFVQHLGTQPAYRDGRLWVFESNGRSAQVGTQEIVWAEIDVRGWPSLRVLQSGRISGGTSHAFAPAAALDTDGNLAVTFTRAGPTEYLSIYYTGRLASDPPNVMREPQLLKAGGRPFAWTGIGRPVMPFIDYPEVALDHEDGTLWMVNLLPTEVAPEPGRAELSDAWLARLAPLSPAAATRRPR
jgi:hypothetical protein